MEDAMNELYKIGEFAKKLGTSKEFLNYYDKQDLVKPYWKDEKGYRYYAPAQWVHVIEYFNLQKIGFSQTDAKNLLENAGKEEWIAQLKQQKETIAQQIQNLQEYYCEAAQMQEALERTKAEHSFTIEYLENYFFCTEPKEPAEEQHRNWKHCPQLQHFWQYVKLSSPASDKLVKGNHKRIWGSLTNLPQRAFSDAAEIPLPAGNCFCYYHSIKAEYDKNGTYLTDNVWNFDEPLRKMKECRLQHGTDLFQQRLALTHEEDGDYVQVKTVIPIRECQHCDKIMN